VVCSDAASHEIRTQLSALRAAIRDVPQNVRRDAVAYKLGGQVRGSLEISAEIRLHIIVLQIGREKSQNQRHSTHMRSHFAR
jgi:hypothetical protein